VVVSGLHFRDPFGSVTFSLNSNVGIRSAARTGTSALGLEICGSPGETGKHARDEGARDVAVLLEHLESLPHHLLRQPLQLCSTQRLVSPAAALQQQHPLCFALCVASRLWLAGHCSKPCIREPCYRVTAVAAVTAVTV